MAEALGGAVCPPRRSWPSSVMAPVALMQAGSDAQKEAWLPQVASGEAVIGVGLTEQIGRRGQRRHFSRRRTVDRPRDVRPRRQWTPTRSSSRTTAAHCIWSTAADNRTARAQHRGSHAIRGRDYARIHLPPKFCRGPSPIGNPCSPPSMSGASCSRPIPWGRPRPCSIKPSPTPRNAASSTVSSGRFRPSSTSARKWRPPPSNRAGRWSGIAAHAVRARAGRVAPDGVPRQGALGRGRALCLPHGHGSTRRYGFYRPAGPALLVQAHRRRTGNCSARRKSCARKPRWRRAGLPPNRHKLPNPKQHPRTNGRRRGRRIDHWGGERPARRSRGVSPKRACTSSVSNRATG